MGTQRIAIPPNMRVLSIDRFADEKAWRLWLHTADYINGTYLLLYDDGTMTRVTDDHGAFEVFTVKEKDNV